MPKRMRSDRALIEVVDNEMAAVLQRKTGAERLAIANGLFLLARRLTLAHVTAQHRDWDHRKVNEEVARRISHGSS